MANPIAEAFVRIRPDMSTFERELQGALATGLGGATAVPAATQTKLATSFFGPSFTSASNTAFQQSLNQSTKNIPQSTQTTMAQALFGPGFRNEAGRAIQGTLAGLGLGQLAAQFAFFGPGGAALAALGTGFLIAARSAVQLDDQLNILQATTGATAEQIEEARQAAIALGADINLPGINAAESAEAITELSKAGLDLQESIAGAEGTLQLAIGGELGVGEAAQIAASGLNAFSLSGDQAVHVADLLAGASVAAQGDVGDMALALQQSAAVADQAGLSIEQLVGLITELARQGIRGSDAGTSIRTGLLRLVPTTKEAAQFMHALGVEIDDTMTIGEQLPELIDQYDSALSKLSPTLRQAVLQQIFGTDAIRFATIAFEQGSEGLDKAIDSANRAGAAQELAEARSKGLGGAIRDLASDAQTLAVSVGEEAVPALTDYVKVLDFVIDRTNEANATPLTPAQELIRNADLSTLADAVDLMDVLNDRITEAGTNEVAEEAFKRLSANILRAAGDAERLRLIFQDTPPELAAIGRALEDGFIDPLERAQLEATEIGRLFLEIAPPEIVFADNIGIPVDDLSQKAKAAGVTVGKKFDEGVSQGISEEDQKAIAAAEKMLEDIREQGAEQVLEAIRSARGSLESLGSSLSDDIADIIDVGPIGQAIDEIEKQLDDLQERVSRRQLRFDLTTAKADLREAQEAIAQTGVLTPEQKRSQEEFLAPFKQKVGDAKAALKEFDLTEKQQELEDTKDAAQKAAEEGVAKLVQQFEDGTISADEFAKKLNNQLGPAFDILKSKAGKNLGLVFTRDFKREVEALIEQAKALSAFFPLGGNTTPGPTVVRPADTQADVNQRIAEQAADIREMRREAKQNAQDSEDNQATTNALLKRIALAVEGKGKRGS